MKWYKLSWFFHSVLFYKVEVNYHRFFRQNLIAPCLLSVDIFNIKIPISSVTLSTIYLTCFLFHVLFLFLQQFVLYPAYSVELNFFSEKTTLLKRTGNNWSSCHSMYFLIFCSKFFDSALNNSYSFFLLHFFLWLQNKGIFGKAPVLCDGFGDFMDDLQNRVGTICFSELWMLISQDCPSSCSAFSVFPRRTVERATNLLAPHGWLYTDW